MIIIPLIPTYPTYRLPPTPERTRTIPRARLSSPTLFKKPGINGQQARYGAELMLDPREHEEDIDWLNDQIAELSDEFKDVDEVCLVDGDTTNRSEYAGLMILSVTSSNRPHVFNKKVEPATEEDQLFYSGSYANVTVSLWPQSNQDGKRINGNLIALQFCGHGDTPRAIGGVT